MKLFTHIKPLVLSLLVLILIAGNTLAQDDIPEKPYPPRLVNDLADVFTDNEEAELEQKLVVFDNSTTTQITVVTVKSLNGYDKADLAFKIGESWGVGQEGFNNGVVILFKPKYDNEKGEVFIAVGYGLEGVIPDATAQRIVEKEMIPYFKTSNIYAGIDAATDVLMKLALEEFSAEDYGESTNSFDWEMLYVLLLFSSPFILIAFLIYLIFFTEPASGSYRSSDNSDDDDDEPSSRITYSNNSSSKSSSGSSFKGFGGGSFGGGGAGGSW